VTKETSLFDAPAPLRRGRHGLSRQEVETSQRIRLLLSITQEVGSRGFGETTIAHITGNADVSKKTFYAHFRDKEHCFSTAYDAFSTFLLDEMRKARAQAGGTPAERSEASAARYLSVLQAQPVRARALLVEVLKAGDAILRQRRRVLEVFEQDLRAMVTEAVGPEGIWTVLPDEAYRMAVGGVDECVRLLIVEGRADELPGLTTAIVDNFHRLVQAQTQAIKP